MKLNLLVIRSAIPDELAVFYHRFGLVFDHHRHGSGPWHYAADIDGLTMEIYPLRKSQVVADEHLRLGFTVKSIAAALTSETIVVSPPKVTEWGYRCVIADPEGRRIELIEHSSTGAGTDKDEVQRSALN